MLLQQSAVEKDKEHEIVVAGRVLESLNLQEKVGDGDGLPTQRAVAGQIVEAGGDYTWIVKDNQSKMRQAIQLLLAPEKSVPGLGSPAMDFRSAKTVHKEQARLQEGTLPVSSLLNEYMD